MALSNELQRQILINAVESMDPVSARTFLLANDLLGRSLTTDIQDLLHRHITITEKTSEPVQEYLHEAFENKSGRQNNLEILTIGSPSAPLTNPLKIATSLRLLELCLPRCLVIHTTVHDVRLINNIRTGRLRSLSIYCEGLPVTPATWEAKIEAFTPILHESMPQLEEITLQGFPLCALASLDMSTEPPWGNLRKVELLGIARQCFPMVASPPVTQQDTNISTAAAQCKTFYQDFLQRYGASLQYLDITGPPKLFQGHLQYFPDLRDLPRNGEESSLRTLAAAFPPHTLMQQVTAVQEMQSLKRLILDCPPRSLQHVRITLQILTFWLAQPEGEIVTWLRYFAASSSFLQTWLETYWPDRHLSTLEELDCTSLSIDNFEMQLRSPSAIADLRELVAEFKAAFHSRCIRLIL